MTGHCRYPVDKFSSLVDLRKFRSYRGRSVRDLLRALRNKVSVGKGQSEPGEGRRVEGELLE